LIHSRVCLWLALSGFFVLVISVFALLSIRYLLRARILGFVLHAVLWFVLLLLGMSTWLVFGRELGGVGAGTAGRNNPTKAAL